MSVIAALWASGSVTFYRFLDHLIKSLNGGIIFDPQPDGSIFGPPRIHLMSVSSEGLAILGTIALAACVGFLIDNWHEYVTRQRFRERVRSRLSRVDYYTPNE